MRRYHETFRLWEYLLFAVVTLAVLCLCVCIGSVRVPLGDTLAFFAAKLTDGALPEGLVSSIMPIRLPRPRETGPRPSAPRTARAAAGWA